MVILIIHLYHLIHILASFCGGVCARVHVCVLTLHTSEMNSLSVCMLAVCHMFPTFVWLRATPIIVGWFMGHTWKNNSKWHHSLP